MRMAILGLGGIGRTLVSEVRSEPWISGLLLVDRFGERARVLAGIPGRAPMEARQLDVEDAAALTKTIRGYDLVVNATLPKHNLSVMRAALNAGANYVDAASSGPVAPGGVLGIFEQLGFHDAFQSAGLTALLCMGLDPGMSNVLARDAADRLDTIDAVRIRSGSTANLDGFRGFPLYSREAFLEDILVQPTVWNGRELEERKVMSEEELYEFPSPVGPLRTFLVSHEEIKTLPRYLEKRVGWVDYKYAIDPDLVQALVGLGRLGLLEESRTVGRGGQAIPFRKALLAALPEPSALLLPLDGAQALAVEVEGTEGGRRIVLRGDIVMTHHDAKRRRSTTAVNCLTSAALAVGAALFAKGALPGPGVFPPEAVAPGRVLREWAARGLPLVQYEQGVSA